MSPLIVFNIFFRLFLFLAIYCISRTTQFDLKEMKCLVCEQAIKEIQKAVFKISPEKKIDLLGYRLDAGGEVKKASKELRRSEVFLTELMESVCNKLDDYVRATHKSSGELVVLPLVMDDGTMNPLLPEVDIIKDGDFQSLKFYCESVLEEYDDDLIKMFQSNPVGDMASNICSKLCGEREIKEYDGNNKSKDEL